MSYREKMLQLWREFVDATGQSEASTTDFAEWAVKNRKWFPRPQDIAKRCAADMSDALRQESRIDEHGIEYRAKHCVRSNQNGIQLVLWADIDKGRPDFLQKSFQQRRQGIVNDCYHLKSDVDHFNLSRNLKAPIQMVLDFTEDVAELDIVKRSENKKRAGGG